MFRIIDGRVAVCIFEDSWRLSSVMCEKIPIRESYLPVKSEAQQPVKQSYTESQYLTSRPSL